MKFIHIALLTSILLINPIDCQQQDQNQQKPIHHDLPEGLEIVDPKSLGLSDGDLSKFLGNVKLLPIGGGQVGDTKTQILTVGFDGDENLNLDDFDLPPNLHVPGQPEKEKEIAQVAFKKFQEYFKSKTSSSSSSGTSTASSNEEQSQQPSHKPVTQNPTIITSTPYVQPPKNQDQKQFHSTTTSSRYTLEQQTPPNVKSIQHHRGQHYHPAYDFNRNVHNSNSPPPPNFQQNHQNPQNFQNNFQNSNPNAAHAHQQQQQQNPQNFNNYQSNGNAPAQNFQKQPNQHFQNQNNHNQGATSFFNHQTAVTALAQNLFQNGNKNPLVQTFPNQQNFNFQTANVHQKTGSNHHFQNVNPPPVQNRQNVPQKDTLPNTSPSNYLTTPGQLEFGARLPTTSPKSDINQSINRLTNRPQNSPNSPVILFTPSYQSTEGPPKVVRNQLIHQTSNQVNQVHSPPTNFKNTRNNQNNNNNNNQNNNNNNQNNNNNRANLPTNHVNFHAQFTPPKTFSNSNFNPILNKNLLSTSTQKSVFEVTPSSPMIQIATNENAIKSPFVFNGRSSSNARSMNNNNFHQNLNPGRGAKIQSQASNAKISQQPRVLQSPNIQFPGVNPAENHVNNHHHHQTQPNNRNNHFRNPQSIQNNQNYNQPTHTQNNNNQQNAHVQNNHQNTHTQNAHVQNNHQNTHVQSNNQISHAQNNHQQTHVQNNNNQLNHAQNNNRQPPNQNNRYVHPNFNFNPQNQIHNFPLNENENHNINQLLHNFNTNFNINQNHPDFNNIDSNNAVKLPKSPPRFQTRPDPFAYLAQQTTRNLNRFRRFFNKLY